MTTHAAQGVNNEYRQMKAPGDCTDLLKGNYIATRLWQSIGKLGPDQVVQTFKKGFSPIITEADGFIQYVGSEQTSAPGGRSFFYNVFETEEEAAAATNPAAVDFVADTILNKQIINPIRPPTDGQFTGRIDFWDAVECGRSNGNNGNTGSFLATRLWKSKDIGVTGQDIVDEFNRGFRKQIGQQEGFQLYTGIVVDEETAFFMNVFDTQEEAEDANMQAAKFISEGPLAGKIALVLANSDVIGFDFLTPPGEQWKSQYPQQHNYANNYPNNYGINQPIQLRQYQQNNANSYQQNDVSSYQQNKANSYQQNNANSYQQNDIGSYQKASESNYLWGG